MTSPRPDDALAREAVAITRYLLDADCPPELAARYASAFHRPVTDGRSRTERVARFALGHPWSLPYIAAAAPFFADGALLRSKLTLMAAILETTPRFAADFLPRDLGLTRLVGVVAAQSLLATLRLVAGVPLLLLTRIAR